MSKYKRRGFSIRKLARGLNGQQLRQIFFGEGWEALTDILIEELASSGWARDALLVHQQQGAFYCRPRNSIIYPPGVLPKQFPEC